ncbi:UNVERIFIED_CONTAM: hypothetical protein FKN15_047524 [Acipenser sinensis]
MKEACRICARDLCGNQRRWIFHPASKLSLQVLLSHVLGREVSRDGKGEFACSKCTFMLDRMYRFDTVIARIEALSIERLQKLLQEKHRLRHCVISLYRKNNCDEQGQEKPVDCTVDISGLSDVKYNALLQEDFVYSGYESWAEHEEQTVEPHVHSNVSEISLHKSRKCRGCASLRVSDSDYEAVCKVPRKVARSISCGPSTRYSASMLGSVCSEDPMTMTPLPESMIVSLPSDKTLEDTDLLEKMSPASSVEFLDTAVEMGSSARKEEETDRELKEDQKSDSWSEEHLAQCSTAAHTNKLDQALMLVKTFEYRPIQSPQGSKLPVLVKSPGCNSKLVFSDMPTGTPHNNICEFPSRFQELVPPQVQQELQLELADLEKLWEDVYVEYLPFCSQNLIEEQQSQLNQYECAAGQCVSELQKAQLQVQTLQTKIQETEAANEMLHQKLMEMECELRAIRQASQKKERTIQGLSEAVSSKDSEETAQRRSQVIGEWAGELQELRKQLSEREREVCELSRQREQPAWAPLNEISRLKRLLQEKEAFIKELMQSSPHSQEEPMITSKPSGTGTASRGEEGEDQEVVAVKEELKLVMRKEQESRMDLSALQSALAKQKEEMQIQAADIESLTRNVQIKEELIKDLQRQLVEPTGLPVVERLTQELQELRETIVLLETPAQQDIETPDRQSVLEDLLSEHSRLNEALKAERQLYNSLVQLHTNTDSSENVQALQMELDAVQTLRGELEEALARTRDGAQRLERAARMQSDFRDLSSAEEVEEDEDDDDDDGSTDYTDSIEEKENLKLTALSLSTNQNVVTHEQGEMAGGSGSSNGVSQVDKEGLLEMRSEIQQLMEQKKAAESELRELKTQLENTGYASLSQMRNAMQSLRLENEQLKSLAGHVTSGWWQKGEAGGLSEEGLRQEVGRLKGRLGSTETIGLLKEQMRLTCQDCGEEGVFSPELIVNMAHKIRERLREEPGPVQGTCSAPEVQLREGSGKRKRSTRPHSLDLGSLLSQSTSESSLQAGLQMDSERFWEHVEASVSEQSQQLRSELALSHQESHELQERLKVSEATLQAQSDQLKHYHVLLTEVSVERENKQVQVDLHDLGYETCGRSETEADREETSSPEYDELDVHGDLYSDARLLEEARPPLLPLKSSLKVQLWTEEEPVKCEDVTALQQHIQDLRAQLCRSEKVIRNLQTRIRSFSTTSDYASSLERPHKVAWSFEASPAHSCLEDDEGWQSDEVAIPAAQPNKELQELVSRVASLETRLKTSSLEGKAAAEDLKSATWPRKYDSLIQAQARELSHLRQKMRESRGVCHILSQHLGDTTKSFEELLRANDIDYYMGQSFREQLAQDTSLAERVSSKLSGQYDELDVHGDLYSDASLMEEARTPLLPLKSSLKVQLWTEEEPVKCEDVTALQQHIQDLRAQLCRSEKVIRNLQTRIRSFSTTSDYASSLERPHKVAWSFEASPAHSCLEDDEGWQSDEVAIPAAQPNKELQELVSRVASLETRLKTSSLEGKAAAEDLKSATWPRKYDSLIQAQARELSHLRQKMRESRGVCHILSQHLGDTTKSFEELLRANDIDYYMGQSFREQLAQDTSLAERVSSKLSGRDRSEVDDKTGHELLALRLSRELQQKDKIIESLRAKLQQCPDTPSSSRALSDSDRTSFVSDNHASTNDDLELCSDIDAASEYTQEEREGTMSPEQASTDSHSHGGASPQHPSIPSPTIASHGAQSNNNTKIPCSQHNPMESSPAQKDLYSGPLSSAVTFPQTHYCPDPSSQFGSLPFNTRPPFLDPSFSGASPFSIAEVHQELQMLQRQLGETAGFAVPHVKPLSHTANFSLTGQSQPQASSYTPLSHHPFHQASPGNSTLKAAEAGLLDSSAVWDMSHLVRPMGTNTYGDVSSGSSGYQSGTSHIGTRLTDEHLAEIRSLRQRLEDSIRTNERLRQQLEERLVLAGRDSGPPTNIYIQGLESVSQLSNENQVLREENLGLKARLNQASRGKELTGSIFLYFALDYTSVKNVLSNTKTLRQILEEAASLLKMFWRAALPNAESCVQHVKTEQSMNEEIQMLRNKIIEQEALLQNTTERLRSTNHSKESMEHFIVSQCMSLNTPQSRHTVWHSGSACAHTSYSTSIVPSSLDLSELLSEVRSLRVQLEQSIQENSSLRQQLEQQLVRSSVKIDSRPCSINISTPRETGCRRQLFQDSVPSPPVRDTDLFNSISPFSMFSKYTDLGVEDPEIAANQDILKPRSLLEGDAPDGSFASKNGRHTIGHVDDFSALQQQILEGKMLVQRMEAVLQPSLSAAFLEISSNKALDYSSVKKLLSNTKTLRQILEEAASLLKMFWRAALPNAESCVQHVKTEQSMNEEIQMLRNKIIEQEALLQNTTERLRSTNHSKESMEHFIVSQCMSLNTPKKQFRVEVTRGHSERPMDWDCVNPRCHEPPRKKSSHRITKKRERSGQCLLKVVTY